MEREYPLQWGRSVNAAETIVADSFSNVKNQLQWGRSVNAAETYVKKQAKASPKPLQWGRSVNAAETVCSISFVEPTSSGYVFERIAGPGRIA